MKQQLNTLQLTELEFLTRIMRTCPQISFDTANLVNKTNANAKALLNNIKEEQDLIQERHQEAIKLIPQEDDKAKDKLVYEGNIELANLNKKIQEIEVHQISSELFKSLEGEKEYNLQDGSTRKISYREVYFELIDKVITNGNNSDKNSPS